MGEPARVLVVDDSPTILKVVGGLLARQGFDCRELRALLRSHVLRGSA